MKKFIAIILLIVSASIITGQQTDFWEGKLKISGITLRLVLKVTTDPSGSVSALLDSPDQGAKDIPVSSISITEDSLKFEIASLMAKYSGKVEKDSMVINGIFKQSGLTLPLNFQKVEKITEIKRPQTPHPPFPYNDEEVIFDNKIAGIKLAGTFTYPKEKKKFPAVILVTGSGAQDRDETIFNHKPFLVIADYLTRNGIAVLRYDDRGVGKSTGNFAAATSADFTTDALSAVEYLKTRSEVDPAKIGIIGHSEGGMIAPMAASSSDDIAFIVLLAGPGMKGSDLLALQTELILKANGIKQDEVDKSLKASNSAYKIIIEEPDSALAYKELEKLYNDDLADLSEEEKNKPENSRGNFEQTAKTLLSPWFRFFLKADPKDYLENLLIPVLGINGEKDLQVPPKENLAGIEDALKSAGNKNYKIVELPGLNHLFQNSKTGNPNEYGEIEETFSPNALKIISDWVLEITK